MPSTNHHTSLSPSSTIPSSLDNTTARHPNRLRQQQQQPIASPTAARRRLPTIPAPPKDSSTSSSPAFVLPGKRGKATRLVLVAVILFPPVVIFLLAMLPFILLFTVVITYSIAWLLYWSRAGAVTFSAMPLDPRRVLKINRVVFSVIFSNFSLIPIGLSLVRYRYWTMRRSTDYITDVHYNPKRPSNKLDVYIPRDRVQTMDSNYFRDNCDEKKLRPVVVFIYGGAWSAGSRLLYTLVGIRLRSMGYLVILPDYSIYPQGTIKGMEEDVKMSIQWAHNNCLNFGGDPKRIYLMGHSAGAHLCAITVLNNCIQQIPASLFGSSPDAISTSPILTTLLNAPVDQEQEDALPRLRGIIFCSGVFDIGEHYKHESMRGVEEISAMGRVMGNSEPTFRLNSPTIILQELIQVSTRIDRHYPTESQTRHQNLLRHLRSLWPIETLMIHGDRDQTVPARSSSEFFIELKTLQLGSNARLRVMHGMGHEEPVVALMPCFGRKAPFRQPLMEEICQFIDGHKPMPKTRR